MVEDGVFSYRDLGFPVTEEGMIISSTIQEHLEIRNIYGAVREEKARLDGLMNG